MNFSYFNCNTERLLSHDDDDDNDDDDDDN
jgi:hypothetical protein